MGSSKRLYYALLASSSSLGVANVSAGHGSRE